MIDQNTADTLNKALDLAKQGVVAGFEMVKQAAPYVWSLALRQTIINGIEYAFFALLSLIGMFFLPKSWRWAMKESDESDGDSVVVVFMLTIGLVISFIGCLINAVDLIGNPGYWTIIKISEMLHNK